MMLGKVRADPLDSKTTFNRSRQKELLSFILHYITLSNIIVTAEGGSTGQVSHTKGQ